MAPLLLLPCMLLLSGTIANAQLQRCSGSKVPDLSSLNANVACPDADSGEVCFSECNEGFSLPNTPAPETTWGPYIWCKNGVWTTSSYGPCKAPPCTRLSLPRAAGNYIWPSNCTGAQHGDICNATCKADFMADNGPLPYTKCEVGRWSGVVGNDPCKAFCAGDAINKRSTTTVQWNCRDTFSGGICRTTVSCRASNGFVNRTLVTRCDAPSWVRPAGGCST